MIDSSLYSLDPNLVKLSQKQIFLRYVLPVNENSGCDEMAAVNGICRSNYSVAVEVE